MSKRRRKYSTRHISIMIFMIVVFTVICIRLIDIQVFNRGRYVELGEDQHILRRELQPQRGIIYDRNREPIAINVPAVTLTIDTRQVTDVYRTAARISPLIQKSVNEIVRNIQEHKGVIEIARKQPVSLAEKVKQIDLPELGIRHEMKRKYPKGRTGAQIIGFTDIDGVGRSGVEGKLNHILRGVPGMEILLKTAKAKTLPHPRYKQKPANDGDDIILTLDIRYQRILEQGLSDAVERYSAESGAAVLVNPITGDVLAMASIPSFDPNHYRDYEMGSWRLRAISDQFEPGSTFKISVMAAMLDAGYKSPLDTVFAENGTYHVMGETIRDTKALQTINMKDVIVKSSNIGMSKAVQGFDRNTLYSYLNEFGFGYKTNVELVGEINGILKPTKDWVPFTQLALSYGHEVAVTPLQMCMMYSTIANDGVYAQPYLIKAILCDGKVFPRTERKTHRVITEQTSRIVKQFMADVVKRGTGVQADIEGVELCGKTGTAHMVRPNGAGYYKNRYIASFGGFLPKDDPSLCLFIMVKDPRNVYYGGQVAGVCFKEIMQRIIALEGLDYFSRPDSLQIMANYVPMPDFIGMQASKAIKMAQDMGLTTLKQGNGLAILDQYPAAGTRVKPDERIVLFARKGTGVPHVVGLSVRRARNILSDHNFNCIIKGSGVVVEQDPQAGETVESGTDVKIICRNQFSMLERIR